MRVVVVGANGRTGALAVGAALAVGHEVTGVVRDRSHFARQRALGATPVLGDVELDVTPALAGHDAVIFAAAASGSDADRADAVDHLGVIRTVRGAVAQGVGRFVLISSMYADRPDEGPAFLRPYLEAKQRSDAFLVATALGWTILRPGGLTDQPGTGLVAVARHLPRAEHGIPRADVAAVAVAALGTSRTLRRAFDLTVGPSPVDEALRGLG